MIENKRGISFEVFPPQKEEEFEKAYEVLDALGGLQPDFMSVTYGAAGSRSKKTVELAAYIQNQLQIEALAHLTCVGFDQSSLLAICEEMQKSGVHNLLALRGDRPQDMIDEQFATREFQYASDMVRFLKEKTGFALAGACYPEKHPESVDWEADLEHLLWKQEAGVQMLITQMFFDNELFYRFRERAEKKGIRIPIHTGIMPITSVKQLGTTISLAGCSIPKKLSDLFANYGDKPQEMRKAGMDYAICQMMDLRENGVAGLHLYTMNKPKMATEIVEALGLDEKSSKKG